MAVYKKPEIQAFIAGADLSALKNRFVKFSDEKTVVICGDADKPSGVLMNDPKAGEVAEVAVGGGAKIKLSADLATLGTALASGANGIARAAVAGEWSFGTNHAPGLANDVVPMVIDISQLDKDVS